MGFSSQAGRVLFRTQASQGVFPADFEAEHIAMKLRSGSLGPNRELLVTDPEIGGGRDTVDAYLGAVSWSGDYEFYARPNAITTLIAACLGESATALEGTAGAWKHTLSPSDSATLPFLGIEEIIGGSMEKYHYTDAVVNTFHLEAEANGYLMGSAGLIAARQQAGITEVDPGDVTWDDGNLIVGTNITVTYNSVQLPAKSFSFDINNNFEDDDFRLGSFYLGDLTAKSREITGSFGIRPNNSDLWRKAVYGTTAATQPGGLTGKSPLVIDCVTYEDIPGSDPLIKSRIRSTWNNIVLEPYALEPSGDDIIENDISWRAVRPSPGTPVGIIEVFNGMETIS